MKILAIDSSGVAAGAALTEDGILKSEEFSQNGLTHSVTLLPMAESVLKKAGMKVSDIDLFAVTVGPGSFSGLRIGVTIAKTLAYGVGKRLCPVSTLKAIAGNLPFADKLICPIMDARRDQLYNAIYKWEDGKLSELVSPRAISKEDLASEIKEDVIFIGDGALKFKDYFSEKLGDKAHFAPPTLCSVKAATVAFLAMSEEGENPEDVNPSYLRLSQAEREYNEKMNKGE